MKVTGRVVGITQNAQTLTKFFLVSPELAKICSEIRELNTGVHKGKNDHHELSKSKSCQYQKSLKKLTDCAQNFINPFEYEGNDLINLVSMTVAPPEVPHDVTSIPVQGFKQHETFVQQRIVLQTVKFWDALPQKKLKLFSSTVKAVQVKTTDGVVQIKEDRKLFARVVLLSRSRPDLKLQECIGQYELSIVPRSMLSSDGSKHHMQVKSKLLHHLEAIQNKELTEDPDEPGEAEAATNPVMFVAVMPLELFFCLVHDRILNC